jgi:glycosyltransferase involved in cell wall biosynthesis
MFKVSVIIPTYNRASLLMEAIGSVLSQTYPVFEIVVVDDGSTDRTGDDLRAFVESAPHPQTSIVYLRQNQSGAPVARNTGMAAAKGDWIAFLDSDDRWLPNKLELQCEAINKFTDSCGACVTDASYVNNPDLTQTAFQVAGTHFGSKFGVWPKAAESMSSGHNGMYVQTLIVRSELARNIGGFDASLPLGDDSDFLFNVACKTGICYVDSPLVQIDRTPNRKVGLIELNKGEYFRLQTCQRLFEKWLAGDGVRIPGVRKGITRQLQELYTAWASWYLLSGEREKALDALAQSLRCRPTFKTASKWLMTKCAPGITKNMILKKRQARPAEILF